MQRKHGMYRLILISLVALLGLSACAEVGWVPDSEMRGTTDGGPYGGRGY